MDKEFDKLLSARVKELLLNTEEPYDEGAWERFLERKKRGKKRLIFWFGASIAASIVFALFLNSFYQLRLFPTTTTPIVLNEHEPNRTQPSAQPEELAGVINKQTPEGLKDSDPVELPVHDETVAKLLASSKRKPDNSQKATSKPDKTDLRTIADSLDDVEVTLADLYADSTHLEVKNDKEEKKQLLFGVVLASGIGVGNSNEKLAGAMSYNGGVSFELPIADRLSIGSGLAMNYVSTDREATSFVGDLNNPDKRDDEFQTEYFNVDIPIQLIYRLNDRKENFFAMIGINSYYSVKQQTHVNSTTTRAVHLFSGDGEPIVVTETFKTSETIQSESNELLPAATVDLALSYRILQSGGVIYEVRPFYRHPLSSPTGDGARIPFGGIAVRLLFNSSKK